MAETIIVRGAYAITDPRLREAGVIAGGAVAITGGTVVEAGSFAALAPKHLGARIIGDGTQLLLPGLVDAHSHGRGLSPIQKGVHNDFLENALFDWAYMPILPPELTASLCALRHLRSGCTLLHHNGFDDDGPEGARRAHGVIKTYLSTGIRLAFSPGVRMWRSGHISRPEFGSPSRPVCATRASWRWAGKSSSPPCRPI